MKKEIKLKVSGFTLMELMITLSIAAILVTIAVPSFRNAMQNNRAYTQSNSLLAALNIARSEATKKKMNVFVCSTTASAVCTTEETTTVAACCNGGADWSKGWMVMDNSNNIVQIWGSLDGNPTLNGPDFSITSKQMSYASTGLPSITPTFNFVYDGCTGTNKYSVEVSASGRPSISKTACP